MKRRLFQLTAACAVLAAGGIQMRADKVPPGQVPNAVMKAISEQTKTRGEAAQDIDRETKDGKVIYEVEFRREGGLNQRVKFHEDGSVVTEDRGFADVATAPSVNALPAPVQKTLEEHRAGRVVADIDKEMSNGQTAYEIEFKEKGPNSRIHIASDGSLVRQGARGTYLGAQLSETPKAVQDTVLGLVGNAPIADVDMKTKDGRMVYNVEVRQEGLNRHLQIAENGALLSDSRTGGAAEAVRERVRGAEDRVRDAGERVREEVTDRDARAMKYDEVPALIQRTIQANGEVANLKSIKQEVKDGTVCYAVEFERDGKNTRLKIGQDGSVLEDNRK